MTWGFHSQGSLTGKAERLGENTFIFLKMKAHSWRSGRWEKSPSCRQSKQELALQSQESRDFQLGAFWMPDRSLKSSISHCLYSLQSRSSKQPHFLSSPVHAPSVCALRAQLEISVLFHLCLQFLNQPGETPRDQRRLQSSRLPCGGIRVARGGASLSLAGLALQAWNNLSLETTFKIIICRVR